MSSHIVHEFKETSLEQLFTVSEKRSLKAIAIKVYLHNDPSGTFTLSLKNSSDEVIISKSLTWAEIVTGAGFTANEYHYGYLLFSFDRYVNLFDLTNYKLVLSSSGYSFLESSYLGWIEPHENVLNGVNRGHGFKLYGPKEGGTVRVIDFFDGQSSSTVPTSTTLSVVVAGYLYFGDESTDGSWRMHLDGGVFKHEKRIGGVWTLAETVEAQT